MKRMFVFRNKRSIAELDKVIAKCYQECGFPIILIKNIFCEYGSYTFELQALSGDDAIEYRERKENAQ